MGKRFDLRASKGVLDLLANANKHSDYQGERYYFKGDLCQMSTAESVAKKFGIATDHEDVHPFVTSQEDFDKVTKHLVSHQIEGWWHYVTSEEYCRIKGEWHFNGKYLRRNAEVRKIADELGIFIGESSDSVLYTTSKEDHDTITKELDKKL